MDWRDSDVGQIRIHLAMNDSRRVGRSNRPVCAGVLALCLALVAMQATAQGEPNDAGEEIERDWPISPQLSIGVAAWVQEFEAHVVAPDVVSPVNQGRTSPESAIFMDFALALMGPDFEVGSWSARPFVRGGVLLPVNGENTVLSRLISVFETGVTGQRFLDGSDVAVQWAPIYAAGAGVELAVPGDLGLRLSPSLEFRRTRLEYAGNFRRTVIQNSVDQGTISLGLERDSGQLYLGPALGAAVGFVPFAGVRVSGFLDLSLLVDLDGTHERFGTQDPTFGAVEFEMQGGPIAAEVGLGLAIGW